MAVGRREFLAGLGGAAAGFGLGIGSHWLPLTSPETGPEWHPGRESFTPSTCMLCPSHCGIRGRVVDGSLVRIDGNPLHPISRGGLCPKGRAGIQLLYHPGRLTRPVERIGPPGSDQFRPISWDDALDRVATTLARSRSAGASSSMAWLVGDVSGVMAELLERFTRSYGTPHLLRESYDDGSSTVLKRTQGIDAPPAFDLADADLVLSFGAGLWEAWWGMPQAARAREGHGETRPRWIQADVRLSRTAAKADEWLPVRPGSYGWLALGIAYVLLKEGLYDAKKVQDRVDGLEDTTDGAGRRIPGFRSLVMRHGRPEEVARRIGVAEETLIRVAKAVGTARRPVAIWDQTVAWRSGGMADAMAIHALNILVGALNRRGGVLVQPSLPLPALGDDGHPAPASPAASPLTAADWAARVLAAADAPIEALFLYYSNPVASSPDPDQVRRALERIPLVVSFSPFLDESARHADLVLPDHTYLERWQDAPAAPTAPIAVWGVVRPMVSPLHDTRATGDVILNLSQRLGDDLSADLPWRSVEDLVRQRGAALATATRGSAFAPAFRRDELRELEARGWWLPHGLTKDEFWTWVSETGGWFDPFYDYDDKSGISQLPYGQVKIFPREVRERTSTDDPFYLRDDPATDGQADHGLHLVPYRVMTLASGGTALMPWLLENLGVLNGESWETWAEINPETARELGLPSGQTVRIESPAGSIRVRLRFFDGAQPGALNVPYGLHTVVEGWGRAEGANPLALVGGARDPETGLPDWYSTKVRVLPA